LDFAIIQYSKENVTCITYLVDAKFSAVVTSNSLPVFCISEVAQDVLALGVQGYFPLRNDIYQQQQKTSQVCLSNMHGLL
jgi:hypothetical protein